MSEQTNEQRAYEIIGSVIHVLDDKPRAALAGSIVRALDASDARETWLRLLVRALDEGDVMFSQRHSCIEVLSDGLWHDYHAAFDADGLPEFSEPLAAALRAALNTPERKGRDA